MSRLTAIQTFSSEYGYHIKLELICHTGSELILTKFKTGKDKAEILAKMDEIIAELTRELRDS